MSSEDENTIEDNLKRNNIVNQHIKEIDMLKKESILSIDNVFDQLPKGYIESHTKKMEEEV